jgi:hypothetical protein
MTSQWQVTIGRLIDLVTPAEAANYFAAAGYDPT